jgi:hypothetical protein
MSEYMQRKESNAFTQTKPKQKSSGQDLDAINQRLEQNAQGFDPFEFVGYQQQPQLLEFDNEWQQTQNQKEEEDETTEEQTLYFVTNDNAKIRSDEGNHGFTSEKIPQGTKVYVIETSTSGNTPISKVQYVNNSSTEYWTTTSNISGVEELSDDNYYLAFYNDIEILETPNATESTSNLEAGQEYKLLRKCTVDEDSETFHEVVKRDTEEAVGWVVDYEYVLYDAATKTRQDKLKEFEEWLEERLTEAEGKEGDAQIEFVQGIIGLVETQSVNIAKDPPEYPDVSTLSKTPTFNESTNTDQGATVPHELIEVVRKFINITEFQVEEETEEVAETETTTPEAEQTNKPTTATTPEEQTTTEATTETTEEEETIETVVGGSRHSGIDWNSRLGVPQYRTQSDNLSIPEATCNVTTMAMTLERLGNSRSDVIAAIDAKLKDGKEKTDDELKKLWEEKSEAYMKKINSEAKAKNGYDKLRENKGGLVGKENDLSKNFKDIAQMEDLLDFYLYLKTKNLGNRFSIFGYSYNDKVPEWINPSDEDKYKTSLADLNIYNKKWDVTDYKEFKDTHRHKIKTVLDKGGSVVLSLRHKGTVKKSHIVSIQSITSEGLLLDDPYGSHADNYRFGEDGDFFKGKNENKERSEYNYKNVPHFNSELNDYTKRDFTAEASQNLESDESRGDSQLLKWDMINESKNGFIQYIVYYEKK